jgi:hypothetical protein
MTDEERKKLCERLRNWKTDSVTQHDKVSNMAADEIERLAAEVKALKAEIEAEQIATAKTHPSITEITAAKRLEEIGLNDATVAALLKELKGNAMTWQYREPNGEWQMFSACRQ